MLIFGGASTANLQSTKSRIMSKQDKYTSKAVEEDDGLSNLTGKLSSDLRKNIRMLGSYEIMSPSWISMGDIFTRYYKAT